MSLGRTTGRGLGFMLERSKWHLFTRGDSQSVGGTTGLTAPTTTVTVLWHSLFTWSKAGDPGQSVDLND